MRVICDCCEFRDWSRMVIWMRWKLIESAEWLCGTPPSPFEYISGRASSDHIHHALHHKLTIKHHVFDTCFHTPVKKNTLKATPQKSARTSLCVIKSANAKAGRSRNIPARFSAITIRHAGCRCLLKIIWVPVKINLCSFYIENHRYTALLLIFL